MKSPISPLLKFFDHIASPATVEAHCDIPCGIYTPNPAQVAAQTVEKMVQKLLELKTPAFAEASAGKPADSKSEEAMLAYLNSVTRMVATKEEHAQKCKEELLILWTDYFKEEHLKMFPQLHETFWKAAKLCSKNKQEVNLEAAGQLRKAVDEIATMFTKAEEEKTKHSH